ncbi:hypothetical protein [Citrobacter youngae]|uniref:hypothetical protein n=1 Tax=Citrobacter youngae TaxID=133448 RepID=UPI000E18D03D|nr:hypothetical protein [Citrobacter youngae]STA85021.1 Uncharacterised protein [Citrobacter youngae]
MTAACSRGLCSGHVRRGFCSGLARNLRQRTWGKKGDIAPVVGSLEKVLARYLDEVPVKLAQRGDIAVVENAGARVPGGVFRRCMGYLAKMVLSVCGLSR